MKVSELITRVREDYLDDTLGVDTNDSLVSETALVRFAQEAQLQACRRHELIYDEVTPEVCTIALTQDKREYKLSELITRIKIAKHDGVELCHTTEEDLYKNNREWRLETGKPKAFYIKSRVLYIYPLSNLQESAFPIQLSVFRLPLRKITDDFDDFEIFPEAQEDLIYWMLYRVYNLRDEDLNDPTAAKMYEGLFDQTYGPVIPIDIRTHQLESPRDLSLSPGDDYSFTGYHSDEDSNFDTYGW